METRFFCGTESRRNRVRTTLKNGQPLYHGLDYVEVAGGKLVACFLHALSKPIAGKAKAPVLTLDNIRIEGGVRVKGIRPLGPLEQDGQFLSLALTPEGDHSTYAFRLVASPDSTEPPDDFDPLLSRVEFRFPQTGPSEFDCPSALPHLPSQAPEPHLDYLAKDYESFRRLMLDRLSALIPGAGERNPADQQMVLVELLAYAADRLSYYQDAVATEAYLGTARKRISVRRHARLLDYPMHDGCNARVWIALYVDEAANGETLPGPNKDKRQPGTLFLTKTRSWADAVLPEENLAQALGEGAQPFETLEELAVHATFNEIPFYTWGEQRSCLPKGTTRAELQCDHELPLLEGRVLLLVERADPSNPDPAALANPAHRHPVRLTHVSAAKMDNLTGQQYMEIQWEAEDALPFPLWIGTADTAGPISVALGNVVLADHGRTLPITDVDVPVPNSGRYQPHLPEAPVTQQALVLAQTGLAKTLISFDSSRSAKAAMNPGSGHILPSIQLVEKSQHDRPWQAQRDLLASAAFERHFMAEMDDDGSAHLRFGDGQQGEQPEPGARFSVLYRVGNGRSGNIGPDSIAHLVLEKSGYDTWKPLLRKAFNPLSAQGGLEPEPIGQVQRNAPQAFRTQERAVTGEDYAGWAQTHPQVQKAVASLRWTGSWHTVFVCIDRLGGLDVDDAFSQQMRGFLEPYRLAGHDLVINGPRWIPLELALTVKVKPGYYRSSVKQALLQTFSSHDLPDGRRGFFHPDNFSFGQAVYLSEVYRLALQVAGVASLRVTLHRRSDPSQNAAKGEYLPIGPLEIARLDNDPNLPENGIIVMNENQWEGGL